MNPRDAIVTALTPGSPFNPNGLVFRSVQSLCAFAQLEVPEIMELLAGDLAAQVACKPGKKGKVLVALKVHLPEPAPVPAGAVQQVQVAGGPAFNPPPQPAPGNMPQPFVALYADDEEVLEDDE
jgi:hypothetical protein